MRSLCFADGVGDGPYWLNPGFPFGVGDGPYLLNLGFANGVEDGLYRPNPSFADGVPQGFTGSTQALLMALYSQALFVS